MSKRTYTLPPVVELPDDALAAVLVAAFPRYTSEARDLRALIRVRAVSRRLCALVQQLLARVCVLPTGCARLNDAGLASLSCLTSLELGDNSTITDAGLARLSRLASLGLFYNHTITDTGLAPLSCLASLDLRANHTITTAAREALRARGVAVES